MDLFNLFSINLDHWCRGLMYLIGSKQCTILSPPPSPFRAYCHRPYTTSDWW